MTAKWQAKYSVEAVANTVLDQAEQRGQPIGPMKLQKLMYLMHGYYLAMTGVPLIDEFFEAWQYGPVAPTIYHAFKQFGREPIKKGFRATKFSFAPAIGATRFDEPRASDDDPIFSRVMDFVFEKYGEKTAIYLSDLTHKVGSPWHQVRLNGSNMRNADISNELIQDYFKQFV